MASEIYYYFEYDRPGKRKPGRTSWRMTITHAAQFHPTYSPLMETAETRSNHGWESFKPYAPGEEPLLKAQKKPLQTGT